MNRKGINMRAALGISIAAIMLLSILLPVATATIAPTLFEATLKPGDTAIEHKTVTIPALPPKVDIVFDFDTTGSMAGTLNAAKVGAINVMNAISATGVDASFGVASYMDYPHCYGPGYDGSPNFGYSACYGATSGDYAYKLNQAVTGDKTAVSASINGLAIGNGADGPQDYTRIMYESYSDSSIGWRAGAKKIVINFADNVPHDNNINEGVPGMSGVYSTGGDPGRDEIMGNADDLDLQTVLAQMAANHVVLLEAHAVPEARWDYWTSITGGHRYTLSSATFVPDTVNNIMSILSAPSVSNLHLEASAGYASWLTSVTPASYATVPSGATEPFDLVLTVPAGTTPGDYSFTISAMDGNSVSYGDQSVLIHVTSPNQPPVSNPGGPYTGTEGSAVAFDGSGSSDPDAGDSLTYAWDFGDGATGSGVNPTHTFADNGAYSVSLTVTDTQGATNTATTTATISNANPEVGPITSPADPQPISTAISVSSPFTDAGVLDTHTAQWTWDDGTTSAGTVTETDGSGTVAGSHTYTAPGTYVVTLTVTDKDGGVGTAIASQYIVVYDPSAGFVTGGGWINSPAGAYAADPALTGKANFGFVSKYQKGAKVPTGQTEFQFKAGDLNFHSVLYDWLVVAGARAQYKGTGTINGAGSYSFMLTAVDGAVSGGGGIDKFRIKIWDTTTNAVVYDNQMGAGDNENPTTAIAGGNIVIHSK